jgi:AcrR family transcriptional regulator
MKKMDLRRKRERQRKEDYKQAILQAAEIVIIRKGYSATTMDDVAREAQFSKATIYRYLKSKGEMIFEIILHYFEELELKLIEINAMKKSATEKLREAIRCVLEFYAEKENISHVFMMDESFMKKRRIFVPGQQKFASALDKRLIKMMRAKRKEISAVGSEILREGVATEEFREINIQEAVTFLEAVLEGSLHGRFWYDEEPNLQKETNLIHGFFLNGIIKRENGKGESR